jgi:C4-dicarboxylate transporter DctQ subunit
MRLLRLRSSATLPVKMLPIYSIYFVFLAAVGLRYLYRAWHCARHGADHVLSVEATNQAEQQP